MAEKEENRRRIISVLVEDNFGVLQRVAGVFSRRGFNIETLTVGKSEQPGLSRMIITVTGSEDLVEKITKQLNKLVETIKVIEITGDSVAREACLVKVHVKDFAARNELMNYAKVYEAKVLDATPKAMIFEITGDSDRINAFLELLKPFGIKEIDRTGITAMQKN
ncbi:MAG: acetolactate synthase small subunit [Candidatus Micrarchaeia archaeon]|jgi:acetolactate synthase-1/3 small subunit